MLDESTLNVIGLMSCGAFVYVAVGLVLGTLTQLVRGYRAHRAELASRTRRWKRRRVAKRKAAIIRANAVRLAKCVSAKWQVAEGSRLYGKLLLVCETVIADSQKQCALVAKEKA